MIPNNPDDANLERELREALRRIEPERDFSALPYSKSPVRWPRLLALAAAIVLMISIPAGLIEYRARQQRREQAAANLIQALQITHNKLAKTRQMVASQLDRRNVL